MKAAIVGCGRMGWLFDEDPLTKKPSTHAGAYTLYEKTDLVAACDINTTRLNKMCDKYDIPGRYTDYREMLDKEDIDILSICTHNHYQICMDATKKKGLKAIFCEKPLAYNLKEAEEMVHACKENNILLTVDHTRRWDSTFMKIRELVKEGTIGKIQTVKGFCTVGWMNGGTHLFDLLRYYLGDVDWVQGHIQPDPSTDPGGRAVLKFKNGVMCFVDSTWKDYVYVGADLIGEKGIIEGSGMIRSEQGIRVRKAVPSKGESGVYELEEQDIDSPEWQPPLIRALEDIIEGIEHNKQTLCSGEDGKAAVEIALAIHESHNGGNVPIHLPLRNKELIVKSRFTSFTRDGEPLEVKYAE